MSVVAYLFELIDTCR